MLWNTKNVNYSSSSDKEVMHKITAFLHSYDNQKMNTCVLFLESECVSTPNQSVII